MTNPYGKGRTIQVYDDSDHNEYWVVTAPDENIIYVYTN